MRYISLDNLRNPYPLQEQKTVAETPVVSNSPIQSYERKTPDTVLSKGQKPSGDIILDAPKPSPFLTEVGGTTFRFIIDINGKRYTSPDFKRDLDLAYSESNPYFKEENVSVVFIDKRDITTPNRDYKVGLLYSETSVSKIIQTDEEIVRYIDWLSKPLLGDPTGGKLINSNELGSWQVNISQYDPSSDSGLGFEYTEQLENEKQRGSIEVS